MKRGDSVPCKGPIDNIFWKNGRYLFYIYNNANSLASLDIDFLVTTAVPSEIAQPKVTVEQTTAQPPGRVEVNTYIWVIDTFSVNKESI